MQDRITKLWMSVAALLVATLALVRPADAGGKNRIDAVSFDDAGQATTIRIRGTAVPTFTVYKLERPNRVVIDIAGAELSRKVRDAQDNGEAIAVSTWAVAQLAAYEIDDGGAVVRVVVTLARPGRYDVTAKDHDLVVEVAARDDAPAKVDPAALGKARTAAEQARKDSEAARQAKAKAEADAATARAQAEASKAEAARATQALADAEAAARRAQKTSQQDRDQAKAEVAKAKAAAERTRKQAEAAQAEADQTRKAAEQAKADAERTRKSAEAAKVALERKQAEVDAA
ncbi:MAG: AMIN domain-containing protein, partial [Kofleriaceae bacterium]|nr:AMIN domain-containing protein [Kofleriaceae bacterium]